MTTITDTDWGVAVITPMEQYRPPGAGDSGITATESFARKQPGFTPEVDKKQRTLRCSGGPPTEACFAMWGSVETVGLVWTAVVLAYGIGAMALTIGRWALKRLACRPFGSRRRTRQHPAVKREAEEDWGKPRWR